METEVLKNILDQHKKFIESFGEIGKRADLRGADLRYAHLSGANLRNATMSDANLRDADLSDANLSDANLSGADLRYAIGNGREIKTLTFDNHIVTYDLEFLNIGCKKYTFEEWWKFSDSEISEMEKGALLWWKKYKDALKTLIELSQTNNEVLNDEN